MSSVAMALSGIGKTNYNPSTLNTWLKSNGGYVQQDLFVWASVNSLGLVFTGFIGNADIANKLNSGQIVILNVHNGGHWVLATGISGNTIYVNDPGYSTTSYSMSEIVAGNTGSYRISKGPIGIMIAEL
jgi:ABC-type bacteriocin/lantibiotic exporter with double-glycine peptidase domain